MIWKADACFKNKMSLVDSLFDVFVLTHAKNKSARSRQTTGSTIPISLRAKYLFNCSAYLFKIVLHITFFYTNADIILIYLDKPAVNLSRHCSQHA
jgi:hypothetical protein